MSESNAGTLRPSPLGLFAFFPEHEDNNDNKESKEFMAKHFRLDYTFFLKDFVLLESCLSNEHELAQTFAKYMRSGLIPQTVSVEFSLVLTLSVAALRKTLEENGWDKKSPLSILTLAMCCTKHFLGAHSYRDYAQAPCKSNAKGELMEVNPFFFRGLTSFVCSKSIQNGNMPCPFEIKEVGETWTFMEKEAAKKQGRKTYVTSLGSHMYFQLCAQWGDCKEELQRLFTRYLVFGPHVVEQEDCKTTMLFAVWVQEINALWDTEGEKTTPKIVSLEGLAAHCIRQFYNEYKENFLQEMRTIRKSVEESEEMKALKHEFFSTVYTEEGQEKRGFDTVVWKDAVNVQFHETPFPEFKKIFKDVPEDSFQTVFELMNAIYRFCRKYDTSAMTCLRQSIVDEIVIKMLLLFAKEMKENITATNSPQVFPAKWTHTTLGKRREVEPVVAVSAVADRAELLNGSESDGTDIFAVARKKLA